MKNLSEKEKLLIELQSKFRKNIRGAALIYMGLYDLVDSNQPITPEGISRAVYVPVTFVMQYKYIWQQYSK